MNNLKKKQHYVWKYYLKAWARDEQILCKIIDNIFLTSLENIAQKRFFYESIALNDTELIFVKSFLKKSDPSAEKSLTRLLDLYLINSTADEYIKLCGIEEFHGVVESNAITILDSLYQKYLSFFEKDEYRNNFGFFIGCQYTRTSKMRNNFIRSPLDVSKHISKEKVSKVFTLFFADIIGNWIFSKSKIKLLIN